VKKIIALLFAVLLFGLIFVACSGDNQPERFHNALHYTAFLELLETNGFSFEESGTDAASWLSVNARHIRIEDEVISIYEYDSTEAMLQDSTYISKSGFSIDNRTTGQAVEISWEYHPYWFKQDYVISEICWRG